MPTRGHYNLRRANSRISRFRPFNFRGSSQRVEALSSNFASSLVPNSGYEEFNNDINPTEYMRDESFDNKDQDIILIQPIFQSQPESQDAVQRIEDIVSAATQLQSKQDILDTESKEELEDPTVSEDDDNDNEFCDLEYDNGIEDDMLGTDEIENIIQKADITNEVLSIQEDNAVPLPEEPCIIPEDYSESTTNTVNDDNLNLPFNFSNEYQDAFSKATTDAKHLHPFYIAMMTICVLFPMATTTYKAIWEALQLVDDVDLLKHLPKSISTLHTIADRHLPLTRLVSKDIPLDIKKTASTDKTNGKIYLFDQREMVKDVIENTCLRSKMHFGWGHLIDQPKELWHGRAWHETIRASSVGDSINSQGINKWPSYENGTPVLFSDFVGFGEGKFQGRIRGMAIDYRSQSQNHGTLHAIVERLLYVHELPKLLQDKCISKFDYLTREHRVLVEEPLVYVPVQMITTKIDYTIHGPEPILPQDDCSIFDDNDDDEQQAVEINTSDAKSIIESIADSIDLNGGRIIGDPQDIYKLSVIVNLNKFENTRPIRLRHPLRSELEIMTFGRSHLIEKFILNPDSLEDLIDAIKPAAQELDHGLDMNLHLSPGFSIKAYVCAFQFLHTSDLPQQNDSSGTMRQNANYGCRSCLIDKVDTS
ncbi:hypothetical protein EDC01DRAFT_631209 [Geopyxis carbonaria]|nr:hypothetical protein EDC01DRAFT_631209 [Geopyxis carbonaria]